MLLSLLFYLNVIILLVKSSHSSNINKLLCFFIAWQFRNFASTDLHVSKHPTFEFLENWTPKYNGHSACCHCMIYLSILRFSTLTVPDISFAQNQVWTFSTCVKSSFLIVPDREFGCLHTKYSRSLCYFYNNVLFLFLSNPSNTMILAPTKILFIF
jgi:hypothetical protein